MSSSVKPAPVKWAQRSDLVYLNIEVQDVANPTITVDKDKVVYKAVTSDKQTYEAVLNLFGEINTEESKFVNRDRGAEFVLIKKEPGPYWKRLLKEDTKYHWLKVDFNKWKDEDESDDEAGGGGGGNNFEEMMRQMGGLGGAGMGGLGGPGMGGLGGPGMGGQSPFNQLDDLDLSGDDKDSDDDNLPDLEDESGDNKKAKE